MTYTILPAAKMYLERAAVVRLRRQEDHDLDELFARYCVEDWGYVDDPFDQGERILAFGPSQALAALKYDLERLPYGAA